MKNSGTPNEAREWQVMGKDRDQRNRQGRGQAIQGEMSGFLLRRSRSHYRVCRGRKSFPWFFDWSNN